MFNRSVACVLTMLVAATVTAEQRSTDGKARCQDVALTMTVADVAPGTAGISSDGLGAYVNGEQGVSAIIQTCGGFHDAVIQLYQNSTRTLSYNFYGSYIAGTNVPPPWAQLSASSPFLSKSILNFNQIADPTLPPANPAYYRPDADYYFTTYLWNGGITAPDRNKYDLKYASGDPRSDTGWGGDQSVNYPWSTSPVQVHHVPRTVDSSTGQITPETWVMWPIGNCGAAGSVCMADPSWTGGCCPDQYPRIVVTLLQQGKSNNSLANVGQFTLPFLITLTRK
jgi:hypothetical protein